MNIRGFIATLLLFGLIGIGLIIWGWDDYRDSRTASPEPSDVQLADLEEGTRSENNHLRIGPHAACYYSTVYSYEKKRFDFSKPDEDTSVSECFYPIISPSDPAVRKIQELEKTYGSLDAVPDSIDIESPTQFAVVVKTKRFKKVKDIPSIAIQMEPQVQGLVLNRSRPLGSKEMKLLRESFPETNFDNVLVLEEGRTPSSAASCFTRIGIGVGVIFLGLGLVTFGALRARRAARPGAVTEPVGAPSRRLRPQLPPMPAQPEMPAAIPTLEAENPQAASRRPVPPAMVSPPRVFMREIDQESDAPRGVSVLGIVSLAIGIPSALLSLIPCIGILGIPIAGIGLIVGVVGIFVAAIGKTSGVGLPIAGTVVSLVGLLIAGAWIGLGAVLFNEAEKQARSLRELEEIEAREIRQGPAIPVRAVDLYEAFEGNELGADQLYKGKVLEVTGAVERVVPEGFDRGTVELMTGEDTETVDCRFDGSHKSQLEKLTRGEQVTIRGKCQGKVLGFVTLEKCSLSQSE